jgi:hypothetical protein
MCPTLLGCVQSLAISLFKVNINMKFVHTFCVCSVFLYSFVLDALWGNICHIFGIDRIATYQ